MNNAEKMVIHQKTFAIQWGDMDALGHVNNTKYFSYFQEARLEWMRDINLDMQGPTGPVLIHTACTFLKPVVYPATLTLKSSIHSLGQSSFVIDHCLYQQDILMAEGHGKIVWIDYHKKKSVAIPNAIRACLA